MKSMIKHVKEVVLAAALLMSLLLGSVPVFADTEIGTDNDHRRDFRVASLNGVYYYSVAEALYLASDGDTIVMHADETMEDLIIPSELSVTLDLNGYSLTGSGETSVITVYGDLTIEDTEGGGIITGGTGTRDEFENEMGMYISCSGGGIYVDGGSLTINGGTISGNTVSSGDETHYNGYSVANSASGGGIYVDGKTNFYMTDSTVSGNEAYYGSGIRLMYVDEALISGGNISDNVSTGYGEAVSADCNNLTIAGCTITGNGKSDGEGPFGGINAGGNVVITECTISENGGAGIHTDNGDLIVTDSTISNNAGRGIYMEDGTPTVTNCVISGNKGDH